MVNGIGGPGGGRKIGSSGETLPPVSPAKTERVERPFAETLGKIERVSSPQSVSPLERLRAQEMSLQEFVEAKVNEATAHLNGMLPAADIEKIQEELHDTIANDPDIFALFKAAQSQPL